MILTVVGICWALKMCVGTIHDHRRCAWKWQQEIRIEIGIATGSGRDACIRSGKGLRKEKQSCMGTRIEIEGTMCRAILQHWSPSI